MATDPETLDFTHPAFTTVPPNHWQAQAACHNRPADAPPANWFPDQHHAHDTAVQQALRICRTECPVRWHCLRYALIHDRHRDRGTIVGGLGQRARARLRARLVANGRLPVIRICANPHCRAEFPAKPNTPRENVCCSDTCRKARRKLMQRFGRPTAGAAGRA